MKQEKLIKQQTRKTVKVDTNTHHDLKVQSAKENLSIKELIMKLVKNYLALLTVLTFVGCATTYTKVDKTNWERFEHDQKIAIGMTMEEITKSFGSPQKAEVYTDWLTGTHINWTYTYSIHCQWAECYVTFEEGKVTKYQGFRMEYIDGAVARN